jgi:hypothetical protein
VGLAEIGLERPHLLVVLALRERLQGVKVVDFRLKVGCRDRDERHERAVRDARSRVIDHHGYLGPALSVAGTSLDEVMTASPNSASAPMTSAHGKSVCPQ